MLKIQILSDLHLEFYDFPNKEVPQPLRIKVCAPILAMLGDICPCGEEEDREKIRIFLKYYSPLYSYILWIPGNHEYYVMPKAGETRAGTYGEINQTIRTICSAYDNVIYLNRGTFEVIIENKKYYIIGATLWSYISDPLKKEVKELMSDYFRIFIWNQKTKTSRKIHPLDVNRWHNLAINYIETQIKELSQIDNSRIIVLTHHKPFIGKDRERDEIESSAYEVDLTKTILAKPVKLWAYGHTHTSFYDKVNGVTCISNPKGYPHQHTNFKNDLVVSIR